MTKENVYLRAIIILPTKELGQLPEVISLISIFISTLLVTPPYASLVVLVLSGQTSSTIEMVTQ